MLKKYQTDSHVIYGTLRLEIFTKYPFITQESTLFAEIRIIINQTTALQKIYYICSCETAVSETVISELGMKGISLIN